MLVYWRVCNTCFCGLFHFLLSTSWHTQTLNPTGRRDPCASRLLTEDQWNHMEASLLWLLRWESEGWNPWHSIKTRWWFQRFFNFTPIWGNDPIWLIFFKWVAQPPTRKEDEKKTYHSIKRETNPYASKRETNLSQSFRGALDLLYLSWFFTLYHGKPPSFTTISGKIFVGSLFPFTSSLTDTNPRWCHSGSNWAKKSHILFALRILTLQKWQSYRFMKTRNHWRGPQGDS